MIRFEIFVGKNSEWFFHLIGTNGQIMFVSEGYVSKGNAKRAIRRLKATVAFASVIEVIA